MASAQTDDPPRWPWLSAFEPIPDLAHARPVIAESGMVSSPHHLASEIGLDILKRGGNAVDAAVATSAALMVTTPMQCSPGGDAIWLIRSPDGRIEALDSSGRSPSALTLSAMRSVPDEDRARSPLAITVPGAVDGWAKALARHGSMGLRELLEPAARLAELGFYLSRHLHASFMAGGPVLRRTGALEIWSGSGEIPATYGRLRQPALAHTLRLLGESGGRDLYEGRLARAVVEATQRAGGLLSLDDLAAHQSEWVEPISVDFRGLSVVTTPPSTQGAALLRTLGVLARLAPTLKLDDPAAIHLMVEAVGQALADRDDLIADRDRMSASAAELLDPPRMDALARQIDRTAATPKRASGASTRGLGDTAHLAVVDKAGCAVSLIQSIFFDFGTGIPVKSGGFTLQNRGAAFSLDGKSANCAAPSRRPLHTLTPVMVQRGTTFVSSLGSMGGDAQVQTLIQLLVAMIDNGFDPQQALSQPRWYLDRTHAPRSRILVERPISPEIIEALRGFGHHVDVLGVTEDIMGHGQIVSKSPEGALLGGADWRSDGQAVGF